MTVMHIAKINSGNEVIETYQIAAEFFIQADNLIETDGKVALGDVYDSVTNSFSTPLPVELPAKPQPRFSGETFSINSRTMQWESDALNSIRDKRDQLLKETDYTQVPDFPEGTFKTAMLAYRAALRNLPQQYENNPHEVDWPVKPNTWD